MDYNYLQLMGENIMERQHIEITVDDLLQELEQTIANFPMKIKAKLHKHANYENIINKIYKDCISKINDTDNIDYDMPAIANTVLKIINEGGIK